jgi:hypothetical protein
MPSHRLKAPVGATASGNSETPSVFGNLILDHGEGEGAGTIGMGAGIPVAASRSNAGGIVRAWLTGVAR